MIISMSLRNFKALKDEFYCFNRIILKRIKIKTEMLKKIYVLLHKKKDVSYVLIIMFDLII